MSQGCVMNTRLPPETKYKKCHGFTLTEIIVVAAIVGVVSIIAVPNYIRVRMETNMEMVRQHMRVIAEKMVEITGKTGQYPDPANWPFITSFDLDEQVITAQLSAIDNLCYTTNREDYIVNQPRNDYVFCTQRKPVSECQLAGYKRFCVHANSEMSQYFAPGAVGEFPEFQPSNGNGMTMTGWHSSNFFNPDNFSYFLTDPNLTDQQRVTILSAWLEYEAYGGSYNQPYGAIVLASDTQLFATAFALYTDSYHNMTTNQDYTHATLMDKFNSLFPQVAQDLYLKGINIYAKTNATSFTGWSIWSNQDGSAYSFGDFNGYPALHGHSGLGNVQIGFGMADPNLNQATIDQRMVALNAQIAQFQNLNPYYGWVWGSN